MANRTPHNEERPRTREDAQAMVEFAMVLPVILLLLFGALQFGIAFWKFQQVSHAASQGARVAAVSRTAASPSGRVVDAVKAASPNLKDPAMSASNVTIIGSFTAGEPITVRVSYPLQLTVLGKAYYNGNITSERTTRVEH